MLKGEKTDQKPETLAKIWKLSLDDTAYQAQKLINIGFFEERGEKNDPRYWVPFIYRNELKMIQGSADF